MHTLFINERWVRNDPTLREARGTVESYLESGFGTASEFHPDEYFLNNKKDWNFAIIEKIIEEKPDVVFYMWIFSQYNPTLEVFSIIHKMKIPIVCWWGDFLFEESRKVARILSPFISTHLLVDIPFPITVDAHREKYKHIWPTPINQFFHRGEENNRTIAISFPGGSIEGGNKGPREQYINFLKANGIDVFVGGTRKQETTMQYADNMRKSKLVINFSPRMELGCPLKGRTFEAIWCGAALMEPAGSFLEYHFRPFVDYIPYENEHDLLDKVKYYTEHEKERQEIANRGYEKAIQRYNPFSFWNKIFNDYLISYDLRLDDEKIRLLLNEFISNKKEPFCNDKVFIEEIAYIIQTYGLREFWETGSYLGNSSNFIKRLFPHMVVSSCDIHEGYLEKARQDCATVSYELANSVEYLRNKLFSCSSIPFVFLDSHGHEGGLPLEEELTLIGNSGKELVLCIHDCKIPSRKVFGWDTYEGVDISTELVEKILYKTECDFDIFVPTNLYCHSPLRGRCYVLINPEKIFSSKMITKLFTPIEELP
jgi:hypothetical protein